MEIYVLMIHTDEDSHIGGVAESMEQAKQIRDKFYRSFSVTIEIFDTKFAEIVLNPEIKCYFCRYDDSLHIHEAQLSDACGELEVLDGAMNVWTMYTLARSFGEAEQQFMIRYKHRNDSLGYSW